MTETHVLSDISFPLLFEGVEKNLKLNTKYRKIIPSMVYATLTLAIGAIY